MIEVGPVQYKILQLMNRGYSFYKATEVILGLPSGSATTQKKRLVEKGVLIINPRSRNPRKAQKRPVRMVVELSEVSPRTMSDAWWKSSSCSRTGRPEKCLFDTMDERYTRSPFSPEELDQIEESYPANRS